MTAPQTSPTLKKMSQQISLICSIFVPPLENVFLILFSMAKKMRPHFCVRSQDLLEGKYIIFYKFFKSWKGTGNPSIFTDINESLFVETMSVYNELPTTCSRFQLSLRWGFPSEDFFFALLEW